MSKLQKLSVRDYWYYRGNRFFVICASTIISVFIFFFALLIIYAIDNGRPGGEYDTPYKTYSKVGVSSSVLGITTRVKPIPEATNGGLAAYPRYAYTLGGLTTAEKSNLIWENVKLCGKETWSNSGGSARNGSYDRMDEQGKLYVYDTNAKEYVLKNEEPRQLYAHTAADGMYGGKVADDEPAVVKQLIITPRTYNNYYEVTGLYAPAGEVIKIELSDEAMQATGGLTFHIGQALYNGQANNIWTARNFNRMPIILNTMSINRNTAVYDATTKTWTGYIGSFLGGPIYIRDELKAYTVTISGGVNYQHFILGITTPEEYAQFVQSSVPYFDLEIWSTGVLLSGPRTYAQNMTYDEMYEIASLWEKISLVTNQVKNHGVVFLFDPFVAAGAAVAFPGRWSVNCPASWFREALNYQAFVTSGTWGNLHEYHHNYQGYGVGDRGEVTNNALNLVSYSLFTNISAARQIGNYGGAGFSGWNTYTSATWALNRVNTGAISSTNGLAVYATLLHNFGQDAFIQTTNASGNNYFNRWAAVTHQDFSYYDDLVKSFGRTTSPTATDYPLFVPVSCVYQTGRSYNYDGQRRYFETMQPYTIPYGQEFTLDLNPYTTNKDGQYVSGSVVIAKDFTYRVKRVYGLGLNGTLQAVGDNLYRFVPNGILRSGKIYVTLEILTKDGQHTYNGKTLDDVDLVLEFQQTHETKKNVLERTIYSFKNDLTAEHYDARYYHDTNYAGASEVTVVDNTNAAQNSNTDIWLSGEQVGKNQIMEVRGKIYFPENGKYRIYLRGRGSCALYLSFNNQDYALGAYVDSTINNEDSPYFIVKSAEECQSLGSTYTVGTYYDVTVTHGSWLYFKEVMMVPNAPGHYNSFIGMGIKQWTTPTYTAHERENGEVYYLDQNGNEVSPTVAANPQPIVPTGNPNYATAYRLTYQFPQTFKTDYFYTPNYTYQLGENTFKQYTPDEPSLQYVGNWQYTATASSFGHVYVGQRGAEIRCVFTGTQFGVWVATCYGTNLQIYVDGQACPLTKIRINANTVALVTPEFSHRQHDVIIRCVGVGNVDSVLVR